MLAQVALKRNTSFYFGYSRLNVSALSRMHYFASEFLYFNSMLYIQKTTIPCLYTVKSTSSEEPFGTFCTTITFKNTNHALW